jgi:hypothetical protein
MSDPRAYVEELGQTTCFFNDPEDEAAFRFQPGNWLRRWQVSLPFDISVFCRPR